MGCGGSKTGIAASIPASENLDLSRRVQAPRHTTVTASGNPVTTRPAAATPRTADTDTTDSESPVSVFGDDVGTPPTTPPPRPPPQSLHAPHAYSVSDAGRREIEEQYDAATKIRAVVIRKTTAQSFGFGVGSSSAGATLVTDLVLGGPADGQLQVGDLVDRLNGTDTSSTAFDEFLLLSHNSFTLMLECTRLRALKHPLPEPAPVVDPADLLPPAPRYAGGGPRSPVNARATKNVSISDLLPHIDIQQRRTSFGKKVMSARPNVSCIEEVIEEEERSAPKNRRGSKKKRRSFPNAHDRSAGVVRWVTLKRQPSVPTFGFTTTILNPGNKVVISQIASNISNWVQ